MKQCIILFVFFSLTFMFGCVSRDQHILATSENQLKLRSIQTRYFDTNEKQMMVRNVVAVLQDLNFVIDNADSDLGTVSATKLSRYQVKITVQVRPRDEETMIVRANARYNLKPIEDPQIYQDFFTALEKSLFLTAHSVD